MNTFRWIAKNKLVLLIAPDDQYGVGIFLYDVRSAISWGWGFGMLSFVPVFTGIFGAFLDKGLIFGTRYMSTKIS